MFAKIFLSLVIIFTTLNGYIIIKHHPVKYFVPEYRIKFIANMKDYYHNFESAQLFFRALSSQTSNKGFYTVDMNCNPNNRCEAIIPAPLKTTQEIEYYIEAKDTVGDLYKTQNFTIPQIELPNWQIDNGESVEIKTTSKITNNVEIDGFGERVKIRYIENRVDNLHKVESRFVPSDEVSMMKPDEQKVELNQIENASVESIDLTGVWSVKRTLSSCHSGLYSHKIIKISSYNGKITDNITYKKGTKFFYSPKEGYICQLVDDVQSGSLVGTDSIYTYKSFFEALKLGLKKGEYVKLIDFTHNKIVYELHSKGKVLTTIYNREPNSFFFQ